MLRQPNPLQGGGEFFEAIYAYLQIAGNAYVELVSPEDRPPVELWTLRPDRMTVVPGETGLPGGYEYSVNGRTKRWSADPVSGRSPVLHVKTFNPLDDWYGMSPIEAAAFSVDQHNAAGAWNQALLQNGARPSGALIYSPKDGSPATLTDEQFARLQSHIEEQHHGPRNAGQPLLLEGGLDWREMSLSPKDMDFISSKHTAVRDIALAFGCPPQLLGIPGDNTFSNLREARLALWEQTIIPLLDHLKLELNNWLSPRFGDDLVLDLDLDRVSALEVRRERVWQKISAADFLSINEKRTALGYPPIAGGDCLNNPTTSISDGGEHDPNGS